MANSIAMTISMRVKKMHLGLKMIVFVVFFWQLVVAAFAYYEWHVM